MVSIRTKAHRAAAVLAAAAGLLGVVSLDAASAEPYTATAYSVVGSDTTQDVMTAMSGVVKSSTATGSKSVASWDALLPGATPANPGCVIPKYGAPSILRPNGSSNGINALIAAKTNAIWPATNPNPCTPAGKVIGGANINVARSSRGPNNTSTSRLTFVPFGRDAIMYIYRTNSPTAVADGVAAMTTAEFRAAVSPGGNALVTKGSTTVLTCVPQSGSGTQQFWLTAIGHPTPTTNAANTIANTAFANCGNLQEHDGNDFNTLATAYLNANPNSAVVVPVGAGPYVAQCNGFGIDRSNNFRPFVGTANGGIGDIDGIAAPTGPLTNATTGSCAGNPAYFSFSSGGTVGTYGRDVYNVLWTADITGFGADPGLVSLFVGNTNPNGVCGATGQAIRANYGFGAPNLPCGSTTLTGNS